MDHLLTLAVNRNATNDVPASHWVDVVHWLLDSGKTRAEVVLGLGVLGVRCE